MTKHVGTHDAKTNFSEYVNRVAYAGDRVIVERHGKPVAALIGLEDLRRLEVLDATVGVADNEAAREAAFRRRLEEKGVVVSWPSGPPVPSEERTLVRVKGRPLSEQIIAERR